MEGLIAIIKFVSLTITILYGTDMLIKTIVRKGEITSMNLLLFSFGSSIFIYLQFLMR